MTWRSPGIPGPALPTEPRTAGLPAYGEVGLGGNLTPMEIPPPDPDKLLAAWMEWERGDVTPGRAMANLKTGGLRDLLESISSSAAPSPRAGGSPAVDELAGGQSATWAPLP